MPSTSFWQCVQAHGVAQGLGLRCAEATVYVREGEGYCGGLPVHGQWELNLSEQDGWRFIHLTSERAFASPQAVLDALPLAMVFVRHGRIVALRDLRPHLCAWRWLQPPGWIAYTPAREEIVLRVQGAVQARGLWETAVAYLPIAVGQVLKPGETYAGCVGFDKRTLAAAGAILETIGIMH